MPNYNENKIRAFFFTPNDFFDFLNDFFNSKFCHTENPNPEKINLKELAQFLNVTQVVKINYSNNGAFVMYEDDMEDYNTYNRIDENYRLEDAKCQLDTYFGYENDRPEVLNSEESSKFKTEYGFNPEELYDQNSEHYILDVLASEFYEQQDCNVAENVIWQDVIEEILNEIKE